MTDRSPGMPDEGNPRLVLDASVDALRDSLTAFNNLKARVLDGEIVAKSDVTGALAQLVQLRLALITEIQKHEQQVLKAEGRAADSPIEFDDIRDTIGGRLDRLRAARDAGSVSDEPDAG